MGKSNLFLRKTRGCSFLSITQTSLIYCTSARKTDTEMINEQQYEFFSAQWWEWYNPLYLCMSNLFYYYYYFFHIIFWATYITPVNRCYVRHMTFIHSFETTAMRVFLLEGLWVTAPWILPILKGKFLPILKGNESKSARQYCLKQFKIGKKQTVTN